MKNMHNSQTNLNSQPKNVCGEKDLRPKKYNQGNSGPKSKRGEIITQQNRKNKMFV